MASAKSGFIGTGKPAIALFILGLAVMMIGAGLNIGALIWAPDQTGLGETIVVIGLCTISLSIVVGNFHRLRSDNLRVISRANRSKFWLVCALCALVYIGAFVWLLASGHSDQGTSTILPVVFLALVGTAMAQLHRLQEHRRRFPADTAQP